MTRRKISVMLALIVALYLLIVYGIYATLAVSTPGANDFYSRWMGARALFWRGENPYSNTVTQEIQMGMYGRLALPDEDQVAYAYPLYTAFIIAPLVGLLYAQAQSIWMAFLIFAAVGGALALARLNRIALKPVVLAAMLIGILFFYPTVRGVFLGQFALASFFCIALALWSIDINSDIFAGVLLALATIKPQPAIFLVPLVIIWAIKHRRTKIVMSALGMLGGLIGLGMLWQPTWLFSFVEAMGQYAQYARVGAPAQTVAELLVPGIPSLGLTFIFSLGLIGWMVWRVAQDLNDNWRNFQSTLGLVALVTTWTAGRIGTPDQILLLIPGLNWVGAWMQNWRGWVGVFAFGLIVLPWWVFLTTLRGDTEDVVVTIVLPLYMLGVAIWHQIAQHHPVEGKAT